ncbi:molybdopterin-dependent oxidoreductase [Chloroflexota bacterium]
MVFQSKVRKGWCGPCHRRCGLLVYFDGDQAVKVKGDPKHPVNRGAICQRGRLILEHLYHPDRLNYPLKRNGNRGQGRWQRVTWDQALDEIAEKLVTIRDEAVPEALAFSSGTSRTYSWAIRRFFNLFGSPNLTGANHICMCPSHTVEWSTYGFIAQGDIHNTDCVVVWGFQPSNSYPITTWRPLVEAKKRGAKIVVIDPRRTKEAVMADLWLQIRPGTDVALMLGWLRVIIDENLYDKEFVEKWSVGFDRLKERVHEFSLEKVAEITWIPKEDIVAAARIYATTKPAMITWGLGIDLQGVNTAQAIRARCILRAITGNLDIKGGELLGVIGDAARVISDVEMELNELLLPDQKKKQLGAKEYGLFGFPGYDMISKASKKLGDYVRPPTANMTCCAHPRHVWQAILTGYPYPVKALITQGNNPLIQAADTKMVYKALTSPNLELLVVMDYYMTPTAELADYVLPAAGTLERSDFPASPKAIDPLYERLDDYQFWRKLGVRLDQEEHWPWETIEDVCDYRLQPLGITFKEMVDMGGLRLTTEYRKYERCGFGTPSGKVEIYSSIFDKLCLDPLPSYQEPPESPVSAPELAKEYPLILIATGKFMPMYHSELRQIPSAITLHPDPITDIHPETARGLGIVDGDWVWIETLRGRIKQRARLCDEVHPTMVRVQPGWWFPQIPGEEPSLHGLWESNANILCPVEREYCNIEIGGWPHTALLCKIYKTA